MSTSPITSRDRFVVSRPEGRRIAHPAGFVITAMIVFLTAPALGLFAQQAGSNTSIPVTCTVNGRPASDITVSLNQNAKLVGVDGASLIALLKQLGTPALLSELSSLSTTTASIAPAALQKTGLSLSFDSEKLELHIDVPPRLQRPKAVRITENVPPVAAVRVKPASFSAQLSASGQLDLIDSYLLASSANNPTNLLDTPFSLTLDPALNYKSWVLESDMLLSTSAAQPFSVATARLVKDLPGPGLRLSAGTLSYPTTGFSSDIPILGVGIGSNFAMHPDKLYRPLGHLEFYLKQPSQVRVLVNGQTVRYLELQPGLYNLSDFPFTAGMNNVDLEIRDNQGRVERLARSFAFAQDLLLPGQSSFSANVGLPGWQIASPVISGSERIGVTDNLTLGAYAQADLSNQLGGIEGTLATGIGTLHLDLAGSHSAAHPFDMGGYASYRFFEVERPYVPSLSLSAQYRGQYLLGPESTLNQVPYRWVFQGSIGQALPAGLGLNLGVSYREPWTGAASYNGTAIFTAPIGQGVSLSVTGGVSYSLGGQAVWSGGISILSASGSTMVTSGSQSLTDPTGQFSMSYQPPGVPGLSAQGSLTGLPGASGQPIGASATVNYTANRFRASIGHSISGNGTGSSTTVTNHSFLRFGSALVFADGVFGVSRPVSDDFAVFVPHESLHGVPIGINRSAGSYQAKSDFLGDAVLSDLPSYSNTLVHIHVPQAPIGYDLGDTLFLLSLPYRSGAVISVGTDATVYVDGTLVDANGKPVALIAGSLVPLSAQGKPQPFFTDESGKFQVYNLTPGSYTLKLAAQNWAPVQVTIPAKASGLYELGKIILRH